MAATPKRWAQYPLHLISAFPTAVNPNSTYECLDVQNEAHTEHPRANPIGKQVKGFHSKKKLETPRETNA